MKERPILFSGPMVRALLEGRKTQTRRVVKWPNLEWEGRAWENGIYAPLRINRKGEEYPETDRYGIWGEDWDFACPYGQPGDRLWVKETHRFIAFLEDYQCVVGYREPAEQVLLTGDYDEEFEDHIWQRTKKFFHKENDKWYPDKERPPWRPSIFMPRWASRITLEIVSVRVERVRDISEEDAKAEGIERCEVLVADGKRIYGPERFGYGERNSPEIHQPTAREAFLDLFFNINERAPKESNPWVWVIEFKKV